MPDNTIHLTIKYIEKASYERENNKQDIRWDSKLTGFGLRIYPSGKKSFVISYRVKGRKHIAVIGQFGKLPLKEARKKAQRELVEATDGNDILKEKRKNNSIATMKAMCSTYIEQHAKIHKRTWKQDEERINRNILPPLSSKTIDSITKEDITRLHGKLGQNSPYEANRTLMLLSKIFECAIDWGYLPESAANPTRRIKKFKEQKRDRFVTAEEMPRLLAAIANEENIYARNLLMMFLFTGARKSELLTAKWEYIDFQRNELRLPETKAGRVHYIPLSAPAIDILKSIPKTEGNPYIFVGKKEGTHLVDAKKPWQRIRKEAGIEDVRIHDLRRTVGSWLAQSGKSLHLIGNVLNHSNESTTAVYSRFTDDNTKDALEELGEMIVSSLIN